MEDEGVVAINKGEAGYQEELWPIDSNGSDIMNVLVLDNYWKNAVKILIVLCWYIWQYIQKSKISIS